MKFSTYQPQVNPNTTNAREVAVSNPLAYGEGGKGMQAMAGAFGQMAKVAEKIQDENDAADVAAARAEISQAINESLYSENGIITTGKGKNYEGLADRVNTSITDITNDVASNYNGRVSKILREKYLPGDLTNYGKMAMQAENNERNKYLDTTYSSLVTNSTKEMCSNYGNPDLIDSTRNQIYEAINSRASRNGWDGSTVMAERRAVWTHALESVMNTCISNDDFESAKGYLDKYKKDLDPDVYSRWNKTINERQKNNDDYMFVQNNISKVWHDGHIDYEAIEELANSYASSPTSGGTFNAEGYSTFTKDLQNKGVQYSLGGSGGTSWDCGLYTQHAAAAGGVTLNSRTADGQAIQMEQEGKFTTNKDEAGPYALVFWHVDGSQWDATDNPAEGGDSGGKAYKGITHVGILQPDGTVMQMGGSGLKPIALDTYEVVGYGKMNSSAGGKAGLNFDPKRKENIKNMLLAKANYQEKIYNEEQGRIAESFIDRFNSGDEDPTTLAYEINNSGLSPTNKKRLINSITGRSGAGRRGGSSAEYATDGTKITASKVASMRKKVERYNYYLERGENVPAGVQFEADEASRWLVDNGLDEGGAELGGDTAKLIWRDITKMQQAGKTKSEIRQELIAAGASDTMADWYINNIEE